MRAQRLSIVFKRRGELDHAEKWQGWRLGNLRPTFEPIIWCFKPYRSTLADNVLDYGVGALDLESFKRNTGGVDNLLEVDFEPGETGRHEAQKPVRLLQTLIELCTRKEGFIVDPFAGSGSTAVAALRSERRCLAIEQDSRLCQQARRWLSQERKRSASERAGR
jgi:site-specific DNA-methyltransferase (adenine-specific)